MATIDTIRGEIAPERRFAGKGNGSGGLLIALMTRLDAMAQKRRTRLALLELGDAQLRDIGVSRADAYREGSRPFWR